MTPLGLLLLTKIVLTMVLIVVPFFVLAPKTLDRLTGLGTPTPAFYRLYAMAIFALVVAYAGGLLQTLEGVYPAQIVAMGLVSNIGASSVMIATGYARAQRLLTVFFGLIGVGFLAAVLAPNAAMYPVF